MDQKIYDSYVEILKRELVPALGCTEPIALAYASAKAVELLEAFPERMEALCSGIDVPVFSITFGTADPTQLEELAEATGGRVFDGTQDLTEAFRSVKGYN